MEDKGSSSGSGAALTQQPLTVGSFNGMLASSAPPPPTAQLTAIENEQLIQKTVRSVVGTDSGCSFAVQCVVCGADRILNGGLWHDLI